MKYGLVAILILTASPAPVWGLVGLTTSAQSAQRQTIEDLNEVHGLQARRRQLKLQYDAEKMDVDFDPAKLRAINLAARAINTQIAALGQSAVDLTLKTYDIAPADPNRPILDDTDYGKSIANWGVRFSLTPSHTAFNPRKRKAETFRLRK